MLRQRLTKQLLPLAACVLGAGLLGQSALAANPESVTAEVEFVAPITITEVNSLKFGIIDVNFATTETVVVATNDAVTDAGSNVIGGTQEAAELTITATASQAITILVDNISNGTGYTLGTFTCDYNGGGSGACDGAGLSATSAASAALLVGATMTQAATPAVGAANGSFDVTITYD